MSSTTDVAATARSHEPAPAPPGRARPGPRVPERVQSTLLSVAGVGAFVVLWAVLGENTRFVAGIDEVLATLPEFLARSETWAAVGETWLRVLVSLALGIALGGAAAVLMWRSTFWGRVAGSYVTTLMAVPSTITALLGVFLFLDVQTGAVAVLTVTVAPFVAVIVHSALLRVDAGLQEMAATYRLSAWQRATTVVLPQVAASLMTAVRNEHAHAWKVVVVVELFLVSSGMGFEFDRSFSRFDLVEVMQWLIVFAGILLASEYAVIRPLEKRAQKWKAVP